MRRHVDVCSVSAANEPCNETARTGSIAFPILQQAVRHVIVIQIGRLENPEIMVDLLMAIDSITTAGEDQREMSRGR